jgi:lipopolysaccharide transport system permease protein
MKTMNESTGKHWDILIEPKSHLLQLNLKEVWRYRDLLLLFVRRDFVAQFKQTILGPVWYLIQPILTTIIYMLIFSRIARISTDGILPPILFYMSGIIIWNFFATCLTKVYFPRLVLPISVILSNLIRFGFQFLLLLVMLIYFHFKGYPMNFGVNWLFIPLLLVMMAGIGLGLGIIISSVTTKYRDFAVLLTFAVQLGMYATPIVYPLSFLQNSSYKWILNANPLSPIVECFRYCLFGKGTFDSGSLMYSAIFMLTILLSGIIIFNKVEKSFMDTV